MSFHVKWVWLNQRYFYWLVREQQVIPCTFDGVLPSIGVEVDEDFSRLEALRKAFMINHPSDYGCHHGSCWWSQGGKVVPSMNDVWSYHHRPIFTLDLDFLGVVPIGS